ncbi:hypothetical protein A1O3_02464 [Capronia epimyces CBS 606.96]|uniref:NAD-dependent epimerase/dehydratase domain-containing protein n=1 Tax=Capronia epimyces CBS 606.96 TaxID=1182542 RepID=W9Y9A0_9EURO|nr:uncharacterized protein A1O3_02464 [Capronia epimyces CBS 606.96]EXJ89397.1 hypothetical protein A1O3_02464 [Capronia epimyces CBS 606.96]
MAESPRRVQPGNALMLVTGANGYIGSTIVDELLQQGFNVRGTVRNSKLWLDALFTSKYGPDRFESVIVPDLGVQADFEKVLDGVWGVLHVASDLTLNPDPDKVIKGTIAHTLAALQAAANVSSVKSFVLTSSSTAALIPIPDKEGIVIDEDTWNDAAVAAAWSKDTPAEDLPYAIYGASKTEGERALWKFVRENKPSFAVNTVLPAANYGAILSPEIPGSTMGWVRRLLDGDSNVFTFTPAQWFVNVRDCARLHVAALLDPSIVSRRIFAFAEPVNWTDAVKILRELRPDNKKIPDPPINEGRDLSEILPRDKAEDILKSFYGAKGWTSLRDSIAAGIEDLQ